MSTVYTTDIHCDRCGVWGFQTTGRSPAGLASQSLKAAKSRGWSRSTSGLYLDLCPRCLAESRTEQVSQEVTAVSVLTLRSATDAAPK